MNFKTIYTHEAVQAVSGESTTNSSAISVGRAKAISMQLIGTDFVDSKGSVSLSMDVSNDGANWVDYNMMIDNVDSSATVELSRIGTYNLATSTTVAFMMYPTIPSYQYVRTSIVYNHSGSISVILGISE